MGNSKGSVEPETKGSELGVGAFTKKKFLSTGPGNVGAL